MNWKLILLSIAKPLPELEHKRTDESDDQDENIYADVPHDRKRDTGQAADNTTAAAKYSSKNLRVINHLEYLFYHINW